MSIPLFQHSHGQRPEIAMEHYVPGGITAVELAAEAGTILLGTDSGQLILLQPSGEVAAISSGYRDLTAAVWADAGNFGAAVIGENQVVCFDDQLNPIWDVRITGRITAQAIAPHGGHLAFSTDGCRTHIVTMDRREVCHIDTQRPLDHLAFLSEEPALIGAAEFGTLCSFRLNGTEEWSETIMNNIGDLSVSGCGRRILLSAFNHGVQLYNRNGKQRGSFMIDGIPGRVSAARTRTRLATLTLENRVFWLNFDGEILWLADLSADPPLFLRTGPLGDRLLLGLKSGRLVQLIWA